MPSYVNHKVYAVQAGFDYRLEAGPFPNLTNAYYFKLAAVKAILPMYDWVIWLDDDAWITDFSRRTFDEEIARADEEGKVMVVGDSPVNASGAQTMLNSGVLLLRNDRLSFAILDSALSVDTPSVRAWWDDKLYGYFTNGDQDSLVWAIETGGFRSVVDIVPHSRFNSRLYEYEHSAAEHFICHFPGVPSKELAVNAFAARFGLDKTMIPADLLERYGLKPSAPKPARVVRADLFMQDRVQPALDRLLKLSR